VVVVVVELKNQRRFFFFFIEVLALVKSSLYSPIAKRPPPHRLWAGFGVPVQTQVLSVAGT
jgi:hypothetical protein